MRTILRKVLRTFKPVLRRYLLGPQFADDYPPDIDPKERTIIADVWPTYTMTSIERLYALIESVRYVEAHSVPGAFVECGVWRGGSIMTAAKTLLAYRGPTRNLYLYNTYEGISEPTEHDRDYSDRDAAALLRQNPRRERGIWCIAGLEDVRRHLLWTGYPEEQVYFIQGKVEDTVPAHAPDCIALLRLDTDWFASNKHELEHLSPRLSPYGVLIIDDYGHWEGARQAVDECLITLKARPYLHRIDYGARLLIKPTT